MDKAMEDRVGELRALLAKATDEDLSDGGRYFSETFADLTRCRHEEIGEYQNQHDGRLIEWLWNQRHVILDTLQSQSAALEALEAFYQAVDQMTTRWAGTETLAGIYPSRSNECDDEDEESDWERFAATHARVRDLRQARAALSLSRQGDEGVSADIPVHPVQMNRNHNPSVAPQVVTMRAYEVYCEVYSPQQALITGGCRGGFSVGELVAFLYARSFPKAEWRVRVDEAFRGMKL